MSDIENRGRKFTALILSGILLVFTIVCMVGLASFDKEVPLALGGVAVALASCYPGYLGVNVYQKKIEAKKSEEKNE